MTKHGHNYYGNFPMIFPMIFCCPKGPPDAIWIGQTACCGLAGWLATAHPNDWIYGTTNAVYGTTFADAEVGIG